MIQVKEVQQKYFLRVEEMQLFAPLYLHIQNENLATPKGLRILDLASIVYSNEKTLIIQIILLLLCVGFLKC